MKVLVIGSGGREHALVWKIRQSPLVDKIFACPGNAGIAELAECVPIEAENLEGLLTFALDQKVDLTVVGPEAPLVKGVVNLFQSKGLNVFGPSQEAARLEGSKAFSKELMARVGVPTAAFQTFTHVAGAKHFIVEKEPPFVIKADGLAGGKGVIIANSCEDGIRVVNDMIENKLFGESGELVVIEECLTGDELSVLLFTDGTSIIPLASSQDHKRVYDDDRGPNTGGMGAYSPCPIVSDEDVHKIIERTARPVINELKRLGTPYRGLLYVGLMMTEKGPYVLEFNVRFGDPETQAVLPRLKTDIVPIMSDIARGTLKTRTLEWDPRACLTVVMASGGYPGAYEKGHEIKGLETIREESVVVFHAGTTRNKTGAVVTAGGRVLAVSALGATLKDAHDEAYRAIERITFTGGFYRRDIGKRVFEKMGVGGT
ncbi:MAG: phosphoribosylamine--glycine ligase [Omnitrophica bacterium RIFCSPLOWO2_01_FULL_50_24]|nr:MAG: phosphoribosylamine--glycine ligase [Omnitrophica bacterium RIFCSPLOWO2_01_FULL_50_24]